MFHPKSITGLRRELIDDAAAEKSKDQLREIFRVVRFSTFATMSALSGRPTSALLDLLSAELAD